MPKPSKAKPVRRGVPHVALLIETSLGPGRDILGGIGRYLHTVQRWSVFQQPRNLAEPFPAWLKSWRGDGIIARIQNEEMAEVVASTKIPAVDVLGVARHSQLPLVHVDDALIARMAAEHLLVRGFRHFGFYGIEAENWSTTRRDEFIAAVRTAGRDSQVFEVSRPQFDRMPWELLENELIHWIDRLPKPAALIGSSDICGQMLLGACRRNGVRIPDEIAVLGVGNDTLVCELTDPPLSSVNCNLFQVGFEAAALLECLMASGKPPRAPRFIKPTGIVTRLSTDVIAVEDAHVRTAIRFIREHACENIGADQVLERIPLSRSTLQRRFRSLLGQSVHEAILRCRIQRAITLLTETELPIAQIAEDAGFKYQQYMSEVFRNKVGETPAQLRARTRSMAVVITGDLASAAPQLAPKAVVSRGPV